MWQTDFTYFKIPGWGWYYLSTVIDDFSRYIVHWELFPNMRWEEAKKTIEDALVKSDLYKESAVKPKILSDNGASYIANFAVKFILMHFWSRPTELKEMQIGNKFYSGLLKIKN